MLKENNLDIDLFKQVSKQISVDYKGYDLSNILAIEVSRILIGSEKLKVRSLLKLFLSYSISSLYFRNDIIFVMGKHSRKDYHEIIRYVMSNLKKSSIDYFKFDKIALKFNFYNLLFFFKDFFRLHGITYSQKILLASKICFYKNTINSLEKIDVSKISHKKAVLFSSIHPWEALMLYFYKKNEVLTYSLQHGIYYIYKRTTPVDVMLYENFNADFHISWGNYTIKEFGQVVDKSKVLLGGYPRDIIVKSNNLNTGTKSCIVLLTRKVLESTNHRLLSILLEFVRINKQIDFKLKLHPSLNASDYKKYTNNDAISILSDDKTLSDLFTKSPFSHAICVYTTAYYEAYMYGLKAIRFNDYTSELAEGITDQDIFTDLSSLVACMKLILNESFILKRLEYLVGYKVNNYDKILGV